MIPIGDFIETLQETTPGWVDMSPTAGDCDDSGRNK
jgi:hypothetical protein